ncbi:MAG: TolC family protein [Deltaproteobacteria bacterium]|nr:MAG: TolC family protein [Deltaproteobacteria bacterium]
MFVFLFAALLAQAHPLTLDEAVKLSLERNPDLRRQTLLMLSAEQDKVLARANLLPRVDFNASYQDTRQGAGTVVYGPVVQQVPFVVYHNWFATLTAKQIIFDFKWWNTLSAADLALDSNLAQVDEEKLQISYLVEQRFYELVRAQRQLGVLADAARRSRDQAEFTQRLFEGGRSTQADVYAARANRDNDEINRLGQERTVELARADLALAVGIDPAEPLTVSDPQNLMNDPAAPPPAQDAVARALQNRPSIKAAALTLAANRRSATAAKGDYIPQLSFVASYSRSPSDFATLYSEPTTNSTLQGSINLSWNLFAGLSTHANVTKAELQAALSENDLLTALRNVASDVEKAVAQLSTARAQARVAQQAEGTAKEGLRLARTRQEVGVGTQLEVRDAELKLTQAQLSVVGSLVDGREAESALRRAQGG